MYSSAAIRALVWSLMVAVTCWVAADPAGLARRPLVGEVPAVI